MALAIATGSQNSTSSGTAYALLDAPANSICVVWVTTFGVGEYMPIATTGQPSNTGNNGLVWNKKYSRQFIEPYAGEYVTQEVWWTSVGPASRNGVQWDGQVASGKTTSSKGILMLSITGVLNIDDPFDNTVGMPGLAQSTVSSVPGLPHVTTDPETMVFDWYVGTQPYTGFTAHSGWTQWSRFSMDYRNMLVQGLSLSAAETATSTTDQGAITGWSGMSIAITAKAPPTRLTITARDQNSSGSTNVGGTVNVSHADSILVAFITTMDTAGFKPIEAIVDANANTWAKQSSQQFYTSEYGVYTVQEVWWSYVAATNSSHSMSATTTLNTQKGIALYVVEGATDFLNPWDSNTDLPHGTFDDTGSTTTPQVTINVDTDNGLAFGFFTSTQAYTSHVAGIGWTQESEFSMDFKRMSVEAKVVASPTDGLVVPLNQTLKNWGVLAPVMSAAGGGTLPPEDLEFSAALVDETVIGVTATITEPETGITIAAALVDETVVGVVVTLTGPIVISPKVFLKDESVIGVAVTIGRIGIHPKVALVDESVVGVHVTTHAPYPKFNIAVHLADQDGITMQPPAILPLGGPVFFAWADEGEIFSSGVHGYVEEDVFSFTITQDEGDFAKAQLVLRNPRVGLLSVGRKRWAFLSIKREGLVVPMFYGRLVGIPTNIFEELVTLDFIARPYDFVDRKKAVADSLRTLPYWDPAFIDPDSWEDDDTVLEARTANWFIDRVTHEVSIADLIEAEDGTVEVLAEEYDYDNLQLTLSGAPLRAVQIVATMPWTLGAYGQINITSKLLQGYFAGGGDPMVGSLLYPLVSSFTFDGLSESWPKAGSSVGDGWDVISGSLTNVSFTTVPEATIPWFYDASTIPGPIPEGSFIYPSVITDGTYHSGTEESGPTGFDFNYQMVIVPIGYGTPNMVVAYTADREMGQKVTFTMHTDVQDILTLAPESDVKVVTVNSNPLTDVGYNGEVPIEDSRDRDYIHTPRGQLSLEHLVLLARANLVSATRVVDTTFEVPFRGTVDVLALASQRKAALIHNPRLPGGTVAGKVKTYSLSLDGSTGTFMASFTISSAVGRGGSYESSEGEPIYVDEEYVDPEYQEYKNEIVAVGTGDVTFATPEFAAFDDGVNFRTLTAAKAVQACIVLNTSAIQAGKLPAAAGVDQAAVQAVLEANPTQFKLKMLPMTGGPFLGQVELTVADLVIPKQIDLESAS